MINDYIYIKLYSNDNLSLSNLEVILKDKCNKIVFSGITDNFGKVKIPICDNEIYKLFIQTNLSIIKIPLIAKKNIVYCINISTETKEHLVTIMLMDKNYPNIKIERGKMILWQDIQFQ